MNTRMRTITLAATLACLMMSPRAGEARSASPAGNVPPKATAESQPPAPASPSADMEASAAVVTLPEPDRTGGIPLMAALAKRQSGREFSPREIPLDVLSNLLWAACGINRENGKHTAPTAQDMREMEVYVATAQGLMLYQPATHSLLSCHTRDIRAETGMQAFAAKAPVNLIYVADLSRMQKMPEPRRIESATYDTGYISQNVYLFCASEGLSTVVRGSVDRVALAKAMGLPETKRIMLCQTIGYPTPEPDTTPAQADTKTTK